LNRKLTFHLSLIFNRWQIYKRVSSGIMVKLVGFMNLNAWNWWPPLNFILFLYHFLIFIDFQCWIPIICFARLQVLEYLSKMLSHYLCSQSLALLNYNANFRFSKPCFLLPWQYSAHHCVIKVASCFILSIYIPLQMMMKMRVTLHHLFLLIFHLNQEFIRFEDGLFIQFI